MRAKFLPLMTGTPVYCYATKDALLDSYLPNNNFPNHGANLAGNASFEGYFERYYRFVIAFKTALIPQEEILKLELRFNVTGFTNKHELEYIDLFLHKVLEPWQDDQPTWNTQPLYEEEPFETVRIRFADLQIGENIFIEVNKEYVMNYFQDGILIKSAEEQIPDETVIGFASRHSGITEDIPALIIYQK